MAMISNHADPRADCHVLWLITCTVVKEMIIQRTTNSEVQECNQNVVQPTEHVSFSLIRISMFYENLDIPSAIIYGGKSRGTSVLNVSFTIRLQIKTTIQEVLRLTVALEVFEQLNRVNNNLIN